jgi:hypothetical protein
MPKNLRKARRCNFEEESYLHENSEWSNNDYMREILFLNIMYAYICKWDACDTKEIGIDLISSISEGREGCFYAHKITYIIDHMMQFYNV